MNDDTLISLDDWRRDHLPWRLGELAGALVDGGIATKADVRRAVDDVDDFAGNRLVRCLAELARALVEDGIATMADVREAIDDQLADAGEPHADDPFGWGRMRFNVDD